MRCLDDIMSMVIEIGGRWIKAGLSGDDSPKVVIPSVFGVVSLEQQPTSDAIDQKKCQATTGDTGAIKVDSSPNKVFYIGDMQVSFPRPSMDILPFILQDGSLAGSIFAHINRLVHSMFAHATSVSHT